MSCPFAWRISLLAALAFAVGTPDVLFAQRLDPTRVAAGGDVTFTEACQAAGKPLLILEKEELSPTVLANPKWTFRIPATTAARKYATRFKCSDPVRDVDTGELEVTAAPPASGSSSSTAGTAVAPKVLSVVNVTKAATKKTRNDETADDVDTSRNGVVIVELKDTLKLKVENLEAWRKQAANAKTSLVLFLDGVELKNVVATPAARDVGDPADDGALLVMLEPQNDREGVVRKAWVQVLRGAMLRDDRTADQKTITVSVGAAGASPFVSNAEVVLNVWPWYVYGVVAFLLVVAGLLLWLGFASNLLRDSNGADNPPFSLAKHQMALWFVVVVGSYLYVWLITGFFSSISATALTLIGISGATGLIAVTLDSNKRTDAERTRATLQAEHDALDRALNDTATGLLTQLKAAAPGSATAVQLTAEITPKLTRLNELKTLLQAPKRAAHTSERWDRDLLSDENGISFHRFQMAIWTVVLLMVFVGAVVSDILMPDFEPTLLGLMGISSGTYLGFKFPEKAS